MINAVVKTKLHFKKLEESARRGAVNSLAKASSFLRTTIMRGIRYRKNKESKPGQAPFDHGTFRKSVRFSLDRKNLLSYVGPARLINRAQNPDGKLAPETLEFGGTASIKSKKWFVKNPPHMETLGQVSSFFMTRGFGPMYMGTHPGMVMDQAQDNSWWDAEKSNQTYLKRAIRSARKADGKSIYFLSLPMKSTRMAARAARLVVEHFGFPSAQKTTVLPRPYLSPGLDKAKSKLAGFFVNSLT